MPVCFYFIICSIYLRIVFLCCSEKFINPEIQGRGMECRECRERNVDQDSRESLRGFRGNVLVLAFQGMLEKIPRNVPEDSRECYQRFRGIFGKIPGNVQEDSRECFQFQINQSHVLLKKKQMLTYSRRRDLSLLYLINNRKIKQNNLISSYFHFF